MANWYSMDITEIDEFDYLHQPEGILLRSQRKAAKLYHSDETYFLINGSTSGLLSAISATARKGKKLLMARNCHMAVYHAAFLNEMELEYIYPDVIKEYDITDGLEVPAVEDKIRDIITNSYRASGRGVVPAGELISAVVITSPTYEGLLSDVKGIAELVHKYGIPLIVDQAHGAHFGFHPGFPDGAVTQGADIVIHSVHKTLPAPTQTALLHVNGSLVDRESLRRYLRIYQTSSPSYPLMAGIDFCIDFVKEQGKEQLELLQQGLDLFRRRIQDCKRIQVYPSKGDPSKLVISLKNKEITGRQLYDCLRKEYHLQMEMAAGSYCIALLSMMDTKEGIARLADAICEIDKKLDKRIICNKEADSDPPFCPYQLKRLETVYRIDEAIKADYEEIVVEQAADRIAADFVFLYPPGIPILVPGEKIEESIIDVILRHQRAGFTVRGLSQSGIKVLNRTI